MSSAPKRNSTMRVTRTQTMGGSTTIQKGGKKGAAAGQKKVAEKTGGQDDAVAQDKQLEQQLYRTLSMGRKRAKKAAAKTTDKAQSAAASAPLERKKDLALEDMTFEVDDPEWDREMEARKRRHKEDMIDENVAEEGGMGKVPWNPWFTRIGRMNAYSPVEVMDYYWIRHSTGLSYAYLLVCTLMFILFVGLALQKWQDASVQMTAFTKQPSLTTKNDFGTLPYLNGFLFSPKETNRTFTIVSAPLSYVYYEWSLCTDTLHRGVDVNSSISGFLTDGTAYFYNTSCTRLDTLPCQYGYCFNNPQSLHYTEMADQRQYVRFRLLRCRNETLDLGQITSGLRCRNTTRDLESEMDGATITFQGQSVDNIPTIGKKYGVDYTAYRRFYYRAGSSEEVNINMELRNIVENPRFIIDGLDSTMTAFSSISSSVRPRDILSDEDITFFTAKFSLVSPKKEITLKSANILQTIASVCAVCTVLYTLGYGVRAFNRWDFYRNGKFELAELPGDYMENLFDSTRDLELPGYRDLVKSKIENEKKDTEVTLDDIKRKIVDLRKGLAPLIGVAAQQAKIRKKRA